MNDSIEGPRRSKLTFVASCDSRSDEVDQLRRVREPVSRSKSGVQGKVADVVSGRLGTRNHKTNSRPSRFCSPVGMRMPGRNSLSFSNTTMMGKASVHPRHSRRLGRQREVVEIKDDQEADKPENRARFALDPRAAGRARISFRVWTRSEICAEPRLANVGLVLRYRCVDVPAADAKKSEGILLRAGLSLRAVSETPGMTAAAVLRLVLDGILHIDWWEPLRLDSRVSGTPIGRQIWPVPLGCRSQEERCH